MIFNIIYLYIFNCFIIFYSLNNMITFSLSTEKFFKQEHYLLSFSKNDNIVMSYP